MNSASLTVQPLRASTSEARAAINPEAKPGHPSETEQEFSRTLRDAKSDAARAEPRPASEPRAESKIRHNNVRKSRLQADAGDGMANAAAISGGQGLPQSGKSLPGSAVSETKAASDQPLSAVSAASLPTSGVLPRAPIELNSDVLPAAQPTSDPESNSTTDARAAASALITQTGGAETTAASDRLAAAPIAAPSAASKLDALSASARNIATPVETRANASAPPANSTPSASAPPHVSDLAIDDAVAVSAGLQLTSTAAINELSKSDLTEAARRAPRTQAAALNGALKEATTLTADSSSTAPTATLLAEAVRAAKYASDAGATGEHATPAADVDSAALVNAAGGAVPSHTGAAASAEGAVLKLSTGPDAPDFSQVLSERISYLADKNVSVAKLQIDPPQLGPIEVRIEVQGDKAQVWLSAHSLVTRDALESSSPRLREMLSAQGFTHVNVDVSQRSFQDRSPPPRQEWPTDYVTPHDNIHTSGTSPARTSGMLDAYA